MKPLAPETKGILIGLYAAGFLVTVVFQFSERLGACGQAGNCATSYAKAVAWSVIWPASWVAFASGARSLRDVI